MGGFIIQLEAQKQLTEYKNLKLFLDNTLISILILTLIFMQEKVFMPTEKRKDLFYDTCSITDVIKYTLPKIMGQQKMFRMMKTIIPPT